MPKFRPIQNSFSAGAISPLLDMRSDLPGYKNGLRDCVNMTPSSRGPAIGRRGTQYIATVPNAQYGRIFEFELNEHDTYLVVVTSDLIYVLDESGNIRGDNLVVTDFDFDKPNEWVVNTNGGQASVTFQGSLCVLKSGTVDGQFAEAQFIGDATTGITGTTLGNQNELVLQQLTDEFVTIRLGSTAGANDYGEFVVNGVTPTLEYLAPANEYFVSFRTTETDQSISLDKWAVYDITASPGVVSFASPWTDTGISQLQVAMRPNSQHMYFVCDETFPQELFYTNGVWAFQAIQWLSDGGTYPVGSGVSPWGGSGEQPRTLTFFNTRTYLGGSATFPGTFWGTAIDDTPLLSNSNYFDFRTGKTIADNDPIEADRIKGGGITWLNSGKELFIGSSKGEDVCSSVGPNLTPTDISCDRNSAKGGALIQSKEIGTKALFAGAGQNQLFSFDYVRGRDGYVPIDLSYSADHLFAEGSILEIAVMHSKEDVIALPRRNGSPALGIYNQDTNTIGWAEFVTEGLVTSGTQFVSNGDHQIAMLVNRNGDLQVERLIDDQGVYLDSYKTVRVSSPQLTFSGFDHLAGQTVGVIADGWVQEDVVVSNTGTITLVEPALELSAGYHYEQRMKTLPYDSQDADGSTRSKVKHWNRIYVAVLDSAEPLINGKRPPTRQLTTPMDTADPILAGTTYLKASNLGNDRFAQIEIVQDLPYPLTVLGVFGELNSSGQ